MAQFIDPQQFATLDAPYIKYLEKIKSEWVEAEILENNLKALVKVVKRCHEPVPAGTPAKRSRCSTIAEILDIQVDANGNNKPLQSPTPRLEAFDGRPIPSSTAINNFLHQLRSCKPNTHTRIVVLHSTRFNKPADSAFDSLFFCHVLGVELDLSPTDVRNLAQLDHGYEGPVQAAVQAQQMFPMKPGFVSLGFSEETRKRNVAAYLQRKRIGNVAPQVVVVHLQGRDYTSSHLGSASAGILWEPPSLSDNLHQVPIFPTAEVFFRRAIRRCLERAAPLGPDELTGSWLSALAHMDAVECMYSFRNLLADWRGVFRRLETQDMYKLETQDMYKLARSARKTCASLQISINQVAAFRRSHPTARHSECDEASHILERLLGEAKPVSEEIQVCINTKQQIDQHEETRLAIGESKNTVALTVLAFIFIPINTASSMFGMNVTEIGDSASIWAFVIVACALSVCSAIGWFLWRQLGWFRELGQNWGEKLGVRKETEKVGAYY